MNHRLLSASLSLALLSGCPAPGRPPAGPQVAPVVDAGQPVPLASPAIVRGQLAAPPILENKRLKPIAVKAPKGAAPGKQELKKVLQLVDGDKVQTLPTSSKIKTGHVRIHRSESAYSLLRGFHLNQAAEEEEATVGFGAEPPFVSAEMLANAPQLLDDAPLFQADGDGSSYALLANPDRVDLRPQMPPVRYQGGRGTCTFFAIIGIMDYLYRNDAGMPIKHGSPEFLNWLYDLQIKSKIPGWNAARWGGGSVNSFVALILRQEGNVQVSPNAPYILPIQGYMDESVVPYKLDAPYHKPETSIETVGRERLGDALVDRMKAADAFYADPRWSTKPKDQWPKNYTSQGAYGFKIANDQATIEAALAGGQPVQINYPIYFTNDAQTANDWDLPGGAANGAKIPEFTAAKAAQKNRIAYHAVDIVGYERDARAPGGGWFIVRNSWSDGWGERGHCRISYNFTFNYAYDPMVFQAYAKPFSGPVYSLQPPPEKPLVSSLRPLGINNAPNGVYDDNTLNHEAKDLNDVQPPSPAPAPTPEPSQEPTPEPTAEPSMEASPAPSPDDQVMVETPPPDVVEPSDVEPSFAPDDQPVDPEGELSWDIPDVDAYDDALPSPDPSASPDAAEEIPYESWVEQDPYGYSRYRVRHVLRAR